MLDELPAGLIGLRDRALITLGFAGGFRRSELVALNCADLTFVSEGLEAFVRRSKTDQEGAGLMKVIAYGSDPATCPVRSLQDWLELAGIGEGPVFRPINRHEQLGDKRLTDFAVAVIIKRIAKKAGLADAATLRPLAARGLRHRGQEERRGRCGDHGPDRTQELGDGSSLPSPDEEVGEARECEAWVVTAAKTCARNVPLDAYRPSCRPARSFPRAAMSCIGTRSNCARFIAAS